MQTLTPDRARFRDRPGPLAAAMAVSLGVVAVAALCAKTPTAHATLWLLVLAPALEEIVFRGGLQEGLLRHAGAARAGLANVWTAAAFAAAHVAMRPTLASLLTLLPALAIGAIYQRGRRIAPCIAAHVVFNGIWLLWTGLSVST